ncbi:unnamed protein product [Protopolystoma xenopodis]|uniref:Rhodanese domain-containing protein n=1 Tax=Protopolystoma xenopodis TaxID=117903 RepID=A0A448X3M6_9PLAT|nr:unnamed protein product [Protopolystoma xenopodis]
MFSFQSRSKLSGTAKRPALSLPARTKHLSESHKNIRDHSSSPQSNPSPCSSTSNKSPTNADVNICATYELNALHRIAAKCSRSNLSTFSSSGILVQSDTLFEPSSRHRRVSCDAGKVNGISNTQNLAADSSEEYGCTILSTEDLLSRLRRARDLQADTGIILVDLRETRFYQDGHIITSRSANCYTKTMAKRAVSTWHCWFLDSKGCPSPRVSDLHAESFHENDSQGPTVCIQRTSAKECTPIIVIYDQASKGPPPSFADKQGPLASLRYFIDALLLLGNKVYFLSGESVKNFKFV